MKKFKLLAVILLFLVAAAAVVGCSEDEAIKIPGETLRVGVYEEEGGEVEVDGETATDEQGLEKNYETGEEVDLTAKADDNYQFDRWVDGQGDDIEGYSEKDIKVEMDVDKTFLAVFTQGEVTFSGVEDPSAGSSLDITDNISELQDSGGNNLSGDYDVEVHSDIDGEIHTQSSVTFDGGAPQDTVEIAADKLTTADVHELTLKVMREGETVIDTDQVEVKSEISDATGNQVAESEVDDLEIENENQSGDTVTFSSATNLGVEGNRLVVEFVATDDEMSLTRSDEQITVDLKDTTTEDNVSSEIADGNNTEESFGFNVSFDKETDSGNEWTPSQDTSKNFEGGTSKITVSIVFAADVNKSSAETLSKYSFDADGDGEVEFVEAEDAERDPYDQENEELVEVTFIVENVENSFEADTSKIIVEDIEDEYGNVIEGEYIVSEPEYQ